MNTEERKVMQQALSAQDEHARAEISRHIELLEQKYKALCEALAAQQAPNSVEIDGIKTERGQCWKHGDEPKSGCAWCDKRPAQQEPVGYECYAANREGGRNAAEDEYFASRPAHDHDVSRTLFRHGFDRGYDRASAQQDPDSLHLAAMGLARKQMDRIAELEAEVTRFRTDAMNEKSARKAMEQQLAAREPLTDEQIEREWQFLNDEKHCPPDHDDFARAIEAAHGIK